MRCCYDVAAYIVQCHMAHDHAGRRMLSKRVRHLSETDFQVLLPFSGVHVSRVAWLCAGALDMCRPEVTQLASTMFQRFATSNVDDARLAVKIATSLNLPLASLGGADRALKFVLDLLESADADAKRLQPAMAMLRSYPELVAAMAEQQTSCVSVLADVVSNGRRAGAVEVASSLKHEQQVRLSYIYMYKSQILSICCW